MTNERLNALIDAVNSCKGSPPNLPILNADELRHFLITEKQARTREASAEEAVKNLEPGDSVVLTDGTRWEPVFCGGKKEYGLTGFGLDGSWEEGKSLVAEVALPLLTDAIKAGAVVEKAVKG